MTFNTDMIYERLISAVGGSIGGLLAALKANIFGVFLFITWIDVFKVAVFAAVGAVVGLIIRELWKFVKDKFFIKK